MSTRVTVDDQIYERQGLRIAIGPDGRPRDIEPGDLADPGATILACMGEPSFLVRLPYDVTKDEDVPDEIGLGLRRVAQRLYDADREGFDRVEGGMGAVEWVIGPFVHDGTVRLYVDTDGAGFDETMIQQMAAMFVDELTPPPVDIYVTAAPQMPGVAPSWRSSAERASEQAARTGRKVMLVPLDELEPRVPYPTALLAHRMNPPIRLGPFNDFGVAETRWGVEPGPSTALDDFAAHWVFGEQPGYLGPLPRWAATQEDAAEQVAHLRASGGRRFLLRSPRRQITYEHWGATVWTEINEAADPVALAKQLGDVLCRFAADLEVGFVRSAVPSAGLNDMSDNFSWYQRPWLWAIEVDDAYGIQLLTGAHLERANDLSLWKVSKVTDDRWLVQAADLTPWYVGASDMLLRRKQFPDPELLASARADFGDMIAIPENS